MRVLVSWLRDFVDVPGTPDEIARTMSVRGFAVESIEAVGTGHASGDASADAVLDFEITANRPDCMSVVGMAREVATAYGLPFNAAGRPAADLALPTPDSRRPAAEGEPGQIDIVLDNTDLCPRYVGALADVEVKSSPAWMQARLTAAGVRPISNIVDITNYVLIETGQPMHAFDLATLRGPQIRVRAARGGEAVKTLDGQIRELSPQMLVIADASRPVAVAGVMGGADTEVTRATRAIVFESAYFDPLSVRRTSKALGLKTEASMRFERGADPNFPAAAMGRALALLEQIGAGRGRGAIVDQFRTPFAMEPGALTLRRARIGGLLGAEIPDAEVERILSSLGFSAVRVADGWRVTVPTRRVDCRREVDLIEELARHYGFDRLPVTFPSLTSAPPPVDPRIVRARHLRTVLTAAGFSEAVTFGFVAESAAVPFAPEGDLVPIANPLSENFAVLRPSALPGLIDAVSHNRRREQRDVRLFEIGNRFSRLAGERRAVACIWTGVAGGEHWSDRGREVDFFDIKGVAERICAAAQVVAHAEPHRETWLVPGRSAAIVADGTRLGVIGQLTPSIASTHGLPQGEAVFAADIDLDALDQAAGSRQIRVEALPRYPSVTRDISLLVDDTLAASNVRETIRATGPATLVRLAEFDRYQGKGIPDHKVSLSLRLTFRASDRTLTEEEVQSAMETILAALATRHGASQR